MNKDFLITIVMDNGKEYKLSSLCGHKTTPFKVMTMVLLGEDKVTPPLLKWNTLELYNGDFISICVGKISNFLFQEL